MGKKSLQGKSPAQFGSWEISSRKDTLVLMSFLLDKIEIRNGKDGKCLYCGNCTNFTGLSKVTIKEIKLGFNFRWILISHKNQTLNLSVLKIV